MDLGLLIIRLVVGGLLAGHGAQKLFGRLGGLGLDGTGAYLATHGLIPGRRFAALAGLAELVGGLLLIAGLATPVAAALIVSTMIVAARTDHAGKGLWVFNGGAEYALTVASVGLGLAIVGPGDLSLDQLVGLESSGPVVGLVVLVVAAIGATAILIARTRPMVALHGDGPAAAGPMADPRAA
jgi:putative oxidoreductase